MKIAAIGCGAIGSTLVRGIAEGRVGAATLACVLDRRGEEKRRVHVQTVSETADPEVLVRHMLVVVVVGDGHADDRFPQDLLEAEEGQGVPMVGYRISVSSVALRTACTTARAAGASARVASVSAPSDDAGEAPTRRFDPSITGSPTPMTQPAIHPVAPGPTRGSTLSVSRTATHLARLLLFALFFAVAPSALAQDHYATLVAMNEEILALARPATANGVPDLSPAAVAAQRARLEDFRTRLRALDTSGWPVPRQVDYLLVWSKMNDLVFQHRVMQPWSRDPLSYLYQFRSIPHAEVPATAAEREALAGQLRAVPEMVEAAIENLTQPAGELARLAIFLLANFDGVGQGEPYRDEPPEGTIGWFEDLCARLAEAASDLLAACRTARDAADRYHDWLVANVDAMASSAAIGTDNFNWYLEHVRLLPYTVDDLRAIGKREFHRYRFYYLLDRHRNADLPELELTRSAEQHEQRTRAAEAKTRQLIEDLELLTIPDYMPEEFETDVFWSPRAKEDRHFWEELQFRNALNNHIHASIPGHRFDGEIRKRLDNPIRRTHGESARAEGWATYLEEMLIQAGIADDAPRVRELFYAALIKRGSRFFAEIGMHTGEMSLAEANAYMMDWVPYMEEDLGRYDLVGYLRRPGLGSMYLLGKTQIEQLVSERAFQLGEDFDLGEFHDDLLSRGIIPVTLLRWEMAGLDEQARAVWAGVVGKPFPAVE